MSATPEAPLPKAARLIQLNAIYHHYKGGTYRPQGFVWMSAGEFEGWGVLYVTVSGHEPKICARPLSEWTDQVPVTKNGECHWVQRYVAEAQQ